MTKEKDLLLWVQKIFVLAMSQKKSRKKPSKTAKKIAAKKSAKKKTRRIKRRKIIRDPNFKANAQRGSAPRIKPSLRIDLSTDAQLRDWASAKNKDKSCTRGVGDVVDKVVKFAQKKKFNPCSKILADS